MMPDEDEQEISWSLPVPWKKVLALRISVVDWHPG